MKKIGELDIILKPSKIEGIGVFANRDLKKGSQFYWDKRERKIREFKFYSFRKFFFQSIHIQ